MSDYHTSAVGHWIVREHPPTKRAVFFLAGTVLLTTCVLGAGVSEAATRRGERAVYKGTLGKALPGEGAQEARGSAAQGSRRGGAESGGGGAVEICTPNDLESVRNDLTGSYLQVCDIDLAGYTLTPIGTPAAPFNGTYDGGGLTIANFTYSVSFESNVGLFGRVMMGTVRNVHLENVDVLGYENVGSLVGHMHFSTVENSSATGTVSAINQWVGGLIGHVHPGSMVSDSWADVTVQGGSKAGGLVGNHHGSVIENSYATGAVSGSGRVGGLAGYLQWDQFPENFLTVIRDSYATGDVTSSSQYAGGLAGYMELDSSAIIGSHAEGDVFTGNADYAGGLVGYVLPGNTITDSYATGDIGGRMRIGGLVGWLEGSTIEGSYATGAIHETAVGIGGGSGGLVGYVAPGGTIVESYATGEITTANQYAGGLVGYMNGGTVSRSYAEGAIISTERVLGGLIGNVASDNPSFIEESYARGDVSSIGVPGVSGTAGGLIGGMCGGNGHVIQNTYATGLVVATSGRVGGLIPTVTLGCEDHTVINSYWDVETTGQAESGAGEGHTTEEMMMEATFVDWGFDTIWNIVEAQTYPWLRWQMPILMHGSGLLGETRPHSGYIDPRAESTDGTTFDLGVEQITLVFSTPVRNIGGAALDASAFEVRVTGGGAAPSVVGVDASANPAIVLELSGLIPLQQWTTVEANVEDMSGNAIVDLGDLGSGVNEPDRVDLGFLPADVDQNGTVTPEDLLRWRTMNNGTEPPSEGIEEDYLDTNRNDLITPFDLLRFRQLVNGVPPATQAWSGESLANDRP